jgi:hypothetical protein
MHQHQTSRNGSAPATHPLRRNCPPHDWRCPVLMKTDPGHVAWTCAKCGAIAKDLDVSGGAGTTPRAA